MMDLDPFDVSGQQRLQLLGQHCGAVLQRERPIVAGRGHFQARGKARKILRNPLFPHILGGTFAMVSTESLYPLDVSLLGAD
jgi:hypothetical protein